MFRARKSFRSARRWPRSFRAAAVVALATALSARAALAVEIISVAVSGKAGNEASNGPIANTDGTFIAFYSDATDLVRGDDNQVRDVFLRNRTARRVELISVNSAGEQANRSSHAQGDAPGINGSGDVVAFYSDATNLVANDANEQTDVFVRNVDAQTTEIVSLASDGAPGNGPSLNPSVDLTGNLVAFQSLASNLTAGDTNSASDIFVRDRAAGTTERVCDSIQGNGASFAPAISADGFVVAFTSAATNLVEGDTNRKLDVFTCDRRTGQIEIISVSSAGVIGNDDSILPAISADGRFVAYKSLASNLVPNDHNNVVDVFVRDRAQQITERVSVNFFGGDANEGSFPPSISHDGRFVAFGSAANNLVRDDLNALPSVFVRDITIGISLLVDLNDAGEQANGGTPDVPPAISGDGQVIGYVSFAFNLNPNDLNGTADAYPERNPFFCDDESPCPPPLVCVDGMCVEPGGTRTPTPTTTGSPTITPTAGPSDCCQCATNQCEAPSATGCSAACPTIVRNAVCTDTGCAAPTATVTSTTTPAATTPTPTPTGTACAVGTPCPLGMAPNCSEPGNTCSCNGCMPCPAPTAACPGGGTCVYRTFNSCQCDCEAGPTFTSTPASTTTPTRKGTSTATPTASPEAHEHGLDHDGCNCAVSPPSQMSGNGGLLWLSSIAGLILRQRRRKAVK